MFYLFTIIIFYSIPSRLYVSQRNFTQIAGIASQKWAIKYLLLLFCGTCDHSKHHNLGIFHCFENGFHHFKAQRISFHLVHLMASFDDVDNYPCLLIFDLALIYQKVLIRIFCHLWILPPTSCKSFSSGSQWDYEICAVM